MHKGLLANLGSVAGDEVVHGLLLSQTGHRWQYAKSVTAQQDEILGVGAHAGDARVGNIVNRIGRPCVLRDSTAKCSNQ